MSNLCTHDWQPVWAGFLDYEATDCCRVCGDYRPTPQDPREQPWEIVLDDMERGGR